MDALKEFLTTQFGFSVAIMVVALGVILGTVAYCIYFERKISAWIQDRYGPNRVGPRGIFQPIADGLKFILKEDVIRPGADRAIFLLAPALIFAVALIGFAVIPWGGQIRFADGDKVDVQVASLDIGLLYILAVGSIGVYGLVLGGWSSNNKYSFYGSMRAAAQMLSYEVPLGLAILVVVLTSGQLRLEHIVAQQVATTWNVVLHPMAFLVLLVAAFAETNRVPFDLPEAEQELVGGYHTEYSAMKFGLFFLAEYAHMITNSALMIALFFGGWSLLPFNVPAISPWLNESTSPWAGLVRAMIYTGKVWTFLFVYMWVRWTLPRFRFDQLMRLAWRGLIPLSLGLVAVAGVLVYLAGPTARWWAPGPISIWAPVGNVVVLIIVWLVVKLARTPVTGRQANMPPVPALANGYGS